MVVVLAAVLQEVVGAVPLVAVGLAAVLQEAVGAVPLVAVGLAGDVLVSKQKRWRVERASLVSRNTRAIEPNRGQRLSPACQRSTSCQSLQAFLL